MAGQATKLMSVEEFFAWQQRQDDRYELVEGVPLKLMTGASLQHDRITSNVLIDLGNQLDGTPCWPATADVALRTKIRSLRRADVLVTCDEPRLDTYEANDPKMVVEDFPAYDPDANPDEWVWSWAKYGELCNLCPADVEQLYDAVLQALENLKHQPRLLASFVLDAGVPLCL